MANNKFSDSIDETAYQALEDALQLGAYENQPEPRRRSTPKPAEARVPEQNRPRKNDQQAQSSAQAAAALEVSRPYVSMLCDNGKLGKVVMTEGGHRRVRASALEAYRIARTRTAEDAPTPREAGIDAGLYDHDDHYYRNVVREQGLSDLKPKARAKRKSPP